VELLKLLNTKELIAQIICFLMLLAIMRVFLWKKVLAILDKRKDAISSEFKSIDNTKKTLSDIKGEYENKLADIDKEAQARIQAALNQARTLAEGIRTKAELDADKIIENAKATIKDEVGKAREELKEQVVDITIQVAEKVIQEKLSEESDRRLVEDFIKGIEKK
jgi:F-type H+-transporting ATPase subunit b